MQYAPTYKNHWLIISLFSLALLLRILHICFIVPIPFFNHPVVDEKEHYEWALKIIEGDIFSVHKGAFFRSPGYSYFLALLLFVTGKNLFLIKVLQAILGSFSVLLIYKIADIKFGKKVALLSGIISVCYPLFIYYNAMLLDTTIYIFLVLLILFFSIKLVPASSKQGMEKKPSTLLVLVIGLLVALSCITRPNLLLFVPFHIFWMVVILVSPAGYRNFFDEFKHKWKAIVIRIIIYLLPIITIIGLITLRNYLLEREFYLIATNGDLNFYLANNPDTEYTLNLRPGLEWEIFLQRPYVELGENISEKEMQLYWRRKALEYIKRYPFVFFLDKLFNLYKFFDGYEYREIQMYDYYKNYSPIFRIPISFYIISPLAMIGIAFSIKRFREMGLFLLFLIVYAISVILFSVTSRYRLPAVPVLIMFASWTIIRLVDDVRKRDYYFFAIVYSVFIGYIYIFLFWNRPDEREMEKWWTHYNLGLVYYDESNLDKSLSELKIAEKIRSDNMDTQFVIADVYKKSFRFNEAIEKLKIVQKELKEKYSVYNVIISRIDKEIGECYLRMKDVKDAEVYYQEALSFDNTDAVTYNALGIIEIYKGNKEGASKLFEQSLRLNPNYKDAIENLKRL